MGAGSCAAAAETRHRTSHAIAALPRSTAPPERWLLLRRVDVAHAQAHAALAIDLEHLDAHDVAFLELVADAFDALVGDLRDVHETVAARQDRDERAEIHEACHFALIDAADLDVGRDELDALNRGAAGFAVDGCDLDRAVVLDVDRRAGLFRDGADDRAALADDFADFLRVDLHRDDRRRPVRHLLARCLEHLVHLAEDVE